MFKNIRPKVLLSVMRDVCVFNTMTTEFLIIIIEQVFRIKIIACCTVLSLVSVYSVHNYNTTPV